MSEKVAQLKRSLRQHMIRHAALRQLAHATNGVCAARRTFRKLSADQLDVGLEIFLGANIAVLLVVFQGPLIFGGVNLAEVVDARVLL